MILGVTFGWVILAQKTLCNDAIKIASRISLDFGCPFLRILLGSFKSFFFLLRELLLELLLLRDICAPGLPHALAAAEGVAEVGAVLLACVRRRVDGVEADACQ